MVPCLLCKGQQHIAVLLPHVTPTHFMPADHISTFRLYFVLTQHIQAVYCDCTAPAAGNSAGMLPGVRGAPWCGPSLQGLLH